MRCELIMADQEKNLRTIGDNSIKALILHIAAVKKKSNSFSKDMRNSIDTEIKLQYYYNSKRIL